MELKGKTVNFLGDSITEGVGASSVENRYVEVFAQLTGAKINNYGISGTRIAKNKVPSDNPMYDHDFLQRFDGMDEDADMVVVFGGTNDYGIGDAKMGEKESRDPYTFYGACRILMEGLLERYCGKPIVFMTPLKRAYGNDPVINKLGHSLYEYVEIIKELAREYSIPVLDLYSISGITPSIEKVKKELTVDGLHPNDKGHRIIAERLVGFSKAF